jgi:peptidoglycan L-alanyl-D-glutamate endopeptidase CwlK
MDARSEAFLTHVHPDLAKVMRAAAQEPQPFLIVYGIRTIEAERQAVATGHSTTMHSRHLPNNDGVSCAVDVAALIDGKVSFARGREAEVFGKIAAQVKAAASRCLISLEWGGDWTSFKDWGHFQLPWKQYP